MTIRSHSYLDPHRKAYEAADIHYDRYSDVMNERAEKSREEGKAMGREKGALQAKYAVARKMLLKNQPDEDIMEFTGLTQDELKLLKESVTDDH